MQSGVRGHSLKKPAEARLLPFQVEQSGGGSPKYREFSYIYQAHNKTEEACASSVVKVSELRLWWTADPPRPFQLRLAPHSFRPSVASRESLSRLSLSTLARLSQGTAPSSRVTLLVRPLLVAEPGPGDALSTTQVLSVFFHPPVIRRVGLLTITLSVLFRPRGLPFPSCDPNLTIGGFHLTGDSSYSPSRLMSKRKTA